MSTEPYPVGARDSEPMFALLAGGGTAGHAMPALAVAEALVIRGHPARSLAFVGAERGLEGGLWSGAGFSVTLLPGRGIQRGRSVRHLRANARAVAGLARAVARSIGLLRSARPRVVVAAGGYASVATAVAALLLRRPLVVMEQNAVPGAANRMVGRWARACAVAFPGTDLPRARVTGNPLRDQMARLDRSPHTRRQAREELGVDADRHLVVVMGGSLGSQRLNQAGHEAASTWAGRADLALRRVVGSRNWPEWSACVDGGSALDHDVVAYEDRMDRVLAAADVVVARAGGTTVAELAAAGVPSILVPLPGAPGDHQRANARVLADAGAAVIVEDAEMDGARLVAEVTELLGDPDRLGAMSAAAAGCGRPGAAEAVALLVEEVAADG